jgi:hypothetical protein
VDKDKFDIIRIWALGKEKPKASLPFYSKLMFWKKSVPKDSKNYTIMVTSGFVQYFFAINSIIK